MLRVLRSRPGRGPDLSLGRSFENRFAHINVTFHDPPRRAEHAEALDLQLTVNRFGFGLHREPAAWVADVDRRSRLGCLPQHFAHDAAGHARGSAGTEAAADLDGLVCLEHEQGAGDEVDIPGFFRRAADGFIVGGRTDDVEERDVGLLVLALAWPRIFSMVSMSGLLDSISYGDSVAFMFRLAAGGNTNRLPASTIDTAYLTPSTSMVSLALPVGRSLPVIPPTTSDQSMAIFAPVPGTPSMTKSPSTIALPSFTGTSATRILLLLVMLMRTVVIGSPAATRPSSMEKGPTADEILPQLPR